MICTSNNNGSPVLTKIIMNIKIKTINDTIFQVLIRYKMNIKLMILD